MLQTEILEGKVSNCVTRLLDISVDAPGTTLLDRKLIEYPVTRKRELESLRAELENAYQKALVEKDITLKTQESRVRHEINSVESGKRNLKNSISSLSEEIVDLEARIGTLSEQIKNDGRAIMWMNVWRVIWGILCTAGIIIVGLFIVVGFFIKVIGFFMSDSRSED